MYFLRAWCRTKINSAFAPKCKLLACFRCLHVYDQFFWYCRHAQYHSSSSHYFALFCSRSHDPYTVICTPLFGNIRRFTILIRSDILSPDRIKNAFPCSRLFSYKLGSSHPQYQLTDRSHRPSSRFMQAQIFNIHMRPWRWCGNYLVLSTGCHRNDYMIQFSCSATPFDRQNDFCNIRCPIPIRSIFIIFRAQKPAKILLPRVAAWRRSFGQKTFNIFFNRSISSSSAMTSLFVNASFRPSIPCVAFAPRGSLRTQLAHG